MNLRTYRLQTGQISLNIAILSISDRPDLNLTCHGAWLANRLLGVGHTLAAHAVVSENDEAIRNQVQAWIDDGNVDVVLTTDNSTKSSGDVPPSVILSSNSGDAEQFSTLVHDAMFGFVGVVNIRSAQIWAA